MVQTLHLPSVYKGTSIRNRLQVLNKRIIPPVLSLMAAYSDSRKPYNVCESHYYVLRIPGYKMTQDTEKVFL